MWKQISEHTDHGITVRSCRCPYSPSARSSASSIDKSFALGIFFGTFESRGLVSSRILDRKACRDSIVVLFKEKDAKGLRDKHDQVLLEQVGRCTARDPIVIDGASVNDIESTSQQIMATIPKHAWRVDSEWFVDISGSPKPYFLALLGYLRRRALSPKLTLFHPSANYEENELPEDAYTFTSGFDRYIWVPWLWGTPIPSQPWSYIFLLGFEGNRSYEIYNRFEPNFVQAFVARPGYRPEYYTRAVEENAAFLAESMVTPYTAHASDAVLAWKAIRKGLARLPADTNKCIIPLGPKPHALAGGLAALCDGAPAVLYMIPRTYKAHDVAPGRTLWSYEISL